MLLYLEFRQTCRSKSSHKCLAIYAQTNVGLLCCVGLAPLYPRDKAWGPGRSLAWIAGLKSAMGMFVCECCVSGRGLCDGLMARPEESYRLVCLSVI